MQLRELKAELEELLASDDRPSEIPAKQLEQFSTRLEEEDDVELVGMLLDLHKLYLVATQRRKKPLRPDRQDERLEDDPQHTDRALRRPDRGEHHQLKFHESQNH